MADTETLPEAEAAKFRAFLSYSRKDEAAVKRLHKRLETYEIPKAFRSDGKRTLGRFFRDKDELSAAGDLGGELNAKLNEADTLILCASPASAASKYVDAEVAHWLTERGQEKLLAVVLEGEPEHVFPPALVGHEPLASDFRKTGDGEDIGFLKLVAGLLKVDLGELRDRQAAAERARARLRTALSALFAVLAIVASAAAVIAVQQRDRAEKMALEAVDIGAGVVDQAGDLARTYGVPTAAVQKLLKFSEERYERLFKVGVRNDELLRRRALLLVSFAEIADRGGDVASSGRYAETAIAQFSDFLLRGIAPPGGYTKALILAGRAAVAQGDQAAAIKHLSGAVEILRARSRDADAGVDDRDFLGQAVYELASAYMAVRDAKKALPLLQETVGYFEAKQKLSPNNDIANTNLVSAISQLAGAQMLTGDRAGAQASLDRSIVHARSWLAANPEGVGARFNLTNALMKAGQVQVDSGNPKAALPLFAESIALARDLVRADPTNASARNDLGLLLSLQGMALSATGDDKGGAASRTESLTVMRENVRRDPADVGAKRLLADDLDVHYYAQQAAGDAQGALATASEMVEIRRAIVARAPTFAERGKLAYALGTLGEANGGVRNYQGMVDAFGAAITLRRAQEAEAPNDLDVKKDLAGLLHALGQTHRIGQNAQAGLPLLQEAVKIRESLMAAAPDNLEIAFATAESYQQLAVIQSNFDEAACKVSFQRAQVILQALVQRAPNDERFKASLAKTDDILRGWK